MALTGTHFLCLYTPGVAEYYNYKDQFWDMFAPLTPELLKGRVESEFYPLKPHLHLS